MQLIPTERLSFEMDRVHEQQFKNLLMPVYPRVAECVSRGVAQQAESRDADYYEYAWYHKKLDYEGRWRITSTGEYAYATQMEYSEGSGSKAWSVVDLAIQSILFLRGATRWWETISFFGDGRLYAQLNLDGLQLLQSPISGNYPHAVNLAYKAEVDQNVLKLARDTIVRSVAPKSSASADVGLNYFSGSSDLATVAASLLNKLLRSLGHAVVVKRLEEITKSLSVSLA